MHGSSKKNRGLSLNLKVASSGATPSTSHLPLESSESSSTLCDESEYESALRQFDALVSQYGQRGDSTDAQIVHLEARLCHALCLVSLLRPIGKGNVRVRPHISEFLRLVGLSPQQIRYLELQGVSDLTVLIGKTERDCCGLADRGRFSSDLRTRIARAVNAVQLVYNALKTSREKGVPMRTFSEKQLSWSVFSPHSAKKKASVAWRACSAESSSPPLSPRLVVTPVDVKSDSRSSSECGGSLTVLPSSSRLQMLTPSSPGTSSGGSAQSTSSLPGPSTSSQSQPTSSHGARIAQSNSMQFGSGPKSPRSQTRLVHEIPHKWSRSTKYWLNSDSTCVYCGRALGFGFLNAWEKCKSCRVKAHTHCKHLVRPTCGLTPQHLRLVLDSLVRANNQDHWSAVPNMMNSTGDFPAFQYPDTAAGIHDSSSSTNSSAPSTPALPLTMGTNSPYILTLANTAKTNFAFPDTVLGQLPDIVLPDGDSSGAGGSQVDGAEKLGLGSEGTIVSGGSAGTTELATSEGSAGEEVSPSSSGQSGGAHMWNRHRWNMSTIRGPNTQASWSEVTIPFRNIQFNKGCLIGKGRFGEVLHGSYFGDVAVKFLNMDHTDEDYRLQEFKSEVVAHKNTRHDNIVLFMGFCLEQDKLGIVMSLCKGQALHKMLHDTNARVDFELALQIAIQITQGVGYLHTKKILHKDLRSKNIFIEQKSKVVITDFGLFSMKRLRFPQRKYCMQTPLQWLSYLAPEMVRALSPTFEELPFSESSDVYAFGTVWYELLTGTFPFAKEHPDRVIWMVGQGLKTPLNNMKNIRQEVKDIIMRCWDSCASKRPTLAEVTVILNGLPRKRLDRSPSYPAVRSYESLF